jgi:hypothetical protein
MFSLVLTKRNTSRGWRGRRFRNLDDFRGSGARRESGILCVLRLY